MSDSGFLGAPISCLTIACSSKGTSYDMLTGTSTCPTNRFSERRRKRRPFGGSRRQQVFSPRRTPCIYRPFASL